MVVSAEDGTAENRTVAGLRPLLKAAHLEGKVEAAEAWCFEMGIESVWTLKEVDMVEDFVAALSLKMAPAKLLRKRLEEMEVNSFDIDKHIELVGIIQAELQAKEAKLTPLQKESKTCNCTASNLLTHDFNF